MERIAVYLVVFFLSICAVPAAANAKQVHCGISEGIAESCASKDMISVYAGGNVVGGHNLSAGLTKVRSLTESVPGMSDRHDGVRPREEVIPAGTRKRRGL